MSYHTIFGMQSSRRTKALADINQRVHERRQRERNHDRNIEVRSLYVVERDDRYRGIAEYRVKGPEVPGREFAQGAIYSKKAVKREDAISDLERKIGKKKTPFQITVVEDVLHKKYVAIAVPHDEKGRFYEGLEGAVREVERVPPEYRSPDCD